MEKAKQSADELKKEMEVAEVSPEQQETLDDVARHIDMFQEDPQAHHQTLRERLDLAMLDFDADHHSLSEKMRVVLYDLGNAGV